jgi:hypothetical protein
VSPIPKDKKPKRDAIKEALDALRAERILGSTPPTVIVHPRDAAELKALLVEPIAKPKEGPLMKAYREQVANAANAPVFVGRPPLTGALNGQRTTGMVFDEAGESLLSQLTDSLWAVATQHQSIFTSEALYQHVGPGHMEDDWYVKRLNGGNEVHLLCKCRMILVMLRCRYGADVMRQCEEPAFPEEGTLRKDARCGQHHGQ